MLQEKTYKILSYCGIPEDITEHHWISENSCDSYVEYSVTNDPIYETSLLDEWIKENYPELIDTKFLICLDY